MYVYVDEEGKTVATKVADMDMGPEVALPDGYNIKAVGAPLPVSPQDQRQAQQQQQVQQQQQQQQQATHQLAHEIREVETAAAPQRPVLAGFASMEEMTAAADSATPTPPAPVSAYLQSHSSPQMNAGSVEGHDDLGTEGPVGIGIPVSMNDPRAGRIIFPGPDHKAKTILTEESVIPDPIVDPEIPHSDPSQDMVFMLGDYNQYLKSQSASESDGQDAASAADEFLHSLTSAPASDVESDARHSARGRPGQHTVSLRPPIRKQRILSTHGGWIPISRSPDHDRHVTVAILTRKQNGEKKEQVEEKHQENQNPDHRPSEGEEKREAETAAAGDSDVDKSESEPKVHFDDETTSNLNDQPTRVTFSTSSSVSSSKEPERVKSASEDQPAADSSNESESNKQQQAVQKRSKYNVAAVFDHQFNPIFTSKSKSLDEIKDHELYSASKGSYGLRIPRSSDFERDSDGSERIESSLVPSSSLHASSSSSAAFSLRSGLMARQLEESLKRPAGHFLVPVPGHDGGVKAYIVLSS